MKIKYIKGDLIALAKTGMFDVIGHGCNCFNVMGAGIALQIKREFPIAYKEDCKTTKGYKKKLGSYTRANITLDNISFTILNLYTQYGVGYGSCDYNAIRDCLTKVNIEYKNKKIGLPKIGSGLAGVAVGL